MAVWHWSFLRAQKRVSEGVAQTVVGADGQLQRVTGEREEHPILEALRSIDGVEFVDASGYTLVVYKAATFDWALIEDAIRRLVTTFSLPLERVSREEE